MPTYSVKFPDGVVQEFEGPAGMSELDAYQRAKQERDVGSGKIQTTFTGGALKALGKDPRTTQALMTGIGLIPGLEPIAAAAPIASRLAQYGTEKATGETPEELNGLDIAERIGEGALAGYGPSKVSNAAEALAKSTVAHQLPSGQWVKGITGHGILPWAAREGAQAADYMAKNYLDPIAPAIKALPLYFQNLIKLGPSE